MIKTLFPVSLPRGVAGRIIDYSRIEWLGARENAKELGHWWLAVCKCTTCTAYNQIRTNSTVQLQANLRRTFYRKWNVHTECLKCMGRRIMQDNNLHAIENFPHAARALREWIAYAGPRDENDHAFYWGLQKQ
jgi:hypothetical protein